MDMTRCSVIAGDIPDNLWAEVVLAMVHTKNIRPTNALAGKTPYEIFEKKSPKLDHLRILGSTVYALIHEKERKGINSKAAKFSPRAQKESCVDMTEAPSIASLWKKTTRSSGSWTYEFMKTPHSKMGPIYPRTTQHIIKQ